MVYVVKKYNEEIQSSATLRISRQPLQCLVLLLMCHLNTAKFRSTGATIAEENIVIRGLRLNDFESVAPAFRCVVPRHDYAINAFQSQRCFDHI